MCQKPTVDHANPAQAVPSPTLVGRDEMNIVEFPITLLCHRAPRGQNEMVFQDKVLDPRTGREIVRNLTITAPEKYGLPTSLDDDVILALLQLTKRQNNFSRPEVQFTRLQLIETLGWPDKGTSYARLIQSLDRWSSTHLKYENAWWNNEGRCWTSGDFHIIDAYEINDARAMDGQGDLFQSRVTWGKAFFKSCQAGYLKGLDYGFYVQLDLHTAKRMYRFLDKRFYHRSELTFDLRDFACEHIGLSWAYAHNGKIKEKLQPAIEELEARGFLEPLPRDVRFRKEGRRWVITFKHGQSSARPAKTEGPAASVPPLVDALVARGVTAATARELVEEWDAAGIAAKLDVFDWTMARGDKRVQKSPAGYLVASIRRDYAPPRGYVPPAERALQEAAAAGARADQAATARAQAQARDEERVIRAYWEALTPAERDALDAAALAGADPQERAAAQGPPQVARLYRIGLRHDHIRARLREARTT